MSNREAEIETQAEAAGTQFQHGDEPVRLGLIGLGEVAQLIHLPVLRSMPERFRVSAICDVSDELVATIGDQERIPVEGRTTDVGALVGRDDVDAVLVLTSDEYHAEAALAAIGAGKHVLIEKPMCLTLGDADAIIEARDRAGVHVIVGYMRRFAPAFLRAVEEVREMRARERILSARIRAHVGPNSLFIDQTGAIVARPSDITSAMGEDRRQRAARMAAEIVGEDASPELVRTWRKLHGLNSHDLSAMRELIGMPDRVIAASHWNGGDHYLAILDFGDFQAIFESGTDIQARFDAHIEVLSPTKTVRIQYDTPYIRHLPTTLHIAETTGDRITRTVDRPTFVEPYTHELVHFHDVIHGRATPKTTPEDAREDILLSRMIVDAIRSTAARAS